MDTRRPDPAIRAAGIATLLLALGAGAAAADPVKVKLGTLAPRGSLYHRVLQEMGQAWQKAQGDGSRLVVYTDGSQGGEADVVRRMRVGQLNAGLLTVIGLSEIDDAVTALQYMPLVFRDWGEVDHVREALRPALEKRLLDMGYVVLFWAEAGFVQLFSRVPAFTPGDFRQLKLFAWTGNPNQVAIMKSLGYRPVVLETTDIFPALETGLIDAAPVTPIYALVTQMDRAAGHMLRINWVPIVGAAVVTRAAWDAMSPAGRAALAGAGARAGAAVRAAREALDREAVAAMQRRGLRVHEMTPALEAEWRDRIEPVYPRIRGAMVPAEMFDTVRGLLASYRTRPAEPAQ